ncbi:iron chelate uptake ABC transporter family permease subunit, partial [Streptococcus agalactiae]|nr:iron chelate uptake ABC transporter family permease subunit [Streptococcus agalactiae]
MKKLLTTPVMGCTLVILSLTSLFVGVKSIPLEQITHLDQSQVDIFLTSRLPRTISILISGASLSVCGLLMQQLTQNKFVSPTTSGTMDWAKLGVVVTLIFFKNTSIFIQLCIASGFAILGSLLFVTILKMITFKDNIFIPLIGLMLGQIVAAATVFLGTHFQVLQSVNSWLQGNFSIMTSHRYEILYLALPCLFLVYFFAHQFTIVGLGESFAKNLGVAYEKMIYFGLVLVSIMTSLVIIIVGALPFLGLIVPNLISITKGDHMSSTILETSLLGACIVMICDLFGRLVIFPYEVSIGVTLGVLGSAFFLIS